MLATLKNEGSGNVDFWKTASVFRRYDIVDESDLAEVAAALDRKRAEEVAKAHEISSGTNLAQDEAPRLRSKTAKCHNPMRLRSGRVAQVDRASDF